jgi:DDE superfamily endonuclease
MWCVPRLDDEYVARMENVLEIYERSFDPAEPVVCLDERPVQLHGDARPRSRARPGRPAHYDYEYTRGGTANIFCAVEPLAGKHITKVTDNRKAPEFAKMVAEITRRYPSARTIHLVLDNLSTHSFTSLARHYGDAVATSIWSRLTVHFTPKHGSWLNMAEMEIGLLNKQCLGTLRFHDTGPLRKHVAAWNQRVNRERRTINWTFTRKAARKKFGYHPTRTKLSEH